MGHDQTDKVGCHCSVAFLFITDNKPNRFPNFYLFLWRVCFSQTIVCFHNRLGKLILIDFVMHRLMGYIRFAVNTFVSQHFFRLRKIFRNSVFSLCKSAHIFFVTGIDRR